MEPASSSPGAWRMIAGLFAVLTVSSGFGFYNMSVYLNVLSDARAFSVTALSGAVSVFFVVGGVAGIAVARLLERYDVRWIMCAGALLGGLALGLIGFSESLLLTYALFLLFGIGNTGVSIVVSTTLVTRWFPGSNRSVALSVASTGLSMGGILLTPISAWLLNQWSLEPAMGAFGAAFALLIVPIVLLVIRDAPRAEVAGSAASEPVWDYLEARRTRFFVLLTAGYVLCMGAQVGGIAHLYNRVEGAAGYLVAATAVQALTLMSILMRIAGGFLLTRVHTRSFALGNLLGQALGLSVIALAETRLGLLAGAALFGGTVGNLLMLHPLWLAEAFGVSAYPRLFSLSNACSVLGVALGPLLLGLAYDGAGYRSAYLGAVGASLAAALVVFLAGAAPRKQATYAAR